MEGGQFFGTCFGGLAVRGCCHNLVLESILHFGANFDVNSPSPSPIWGVATFIELINSKLVCKHKGNGGHFCHSFTGRGVVATFLELLSSNFVCKYHFGANFDF